MATTTTLSASCDSSAPPRPAAGIGCAGWRLALAGAVLTGIGIGGQRAFGAFVSQLMSGSSLGLATLALVFALGQQAIRTVQPLLGELAERAGAHRLVIGDAVLFVLATLLSTSWGNAPITPQ